MEFVYKPKLTSLGSMSPLGLWKKRSLARFITRLKMNSSQLGLCVDNKHDINCNITSLNYRPSFITTNIPFSFCFQFFKFFFFQVSFSISCTNPIWGHCIHPSPNFPFQKSNFKFILSKIRYILLPAQLHTTPLIICSISRPIHKSTIQHLLILTHCPPLPALLPLPPKI